MAVRNYKPTTPARRGMTTRDSDAITSSDKPMKSLRGAKKSQAGRNNQGRITTRHRGGGVKRFHRNVSFSLPSGLQATVEQIEYDPNRSANVALIKDQNDNYYYVLAGNNMKIGDKVDTGETAPIEPGNHLPLANIPVGSQIYNIEIKPGSNGKIARSAGSKAQLTSKEGKYAQIRLPSSEIRKFHLQCVATIGSVGNEQHQNTKYGSAGRRRKMGWRPSVRGVVMNAADHPHGGGDGGSHGPGRDPKTPWGQLTLGRKTRRRKQNQDLIVRSRHESKRR